MEDSLKYVREDAPLTPDTSLKLDLAELSRGKGPTTRNLHNRKMINDIIFEITNFGSKIGIIVN